MRLPALFRTTPFRLTLLFLALFAIGAGGLLAYIYSATAGQIIRRARAEVSLEISTLQRAYERGGFDAVNQMVIERTLADPRYVALLLAPDGRKISGTLEVTPADPPTEVDEWVPFRIQDLAPDGRPIRREALGKQVRLPGGELLFIGEEIAEE